MHCVMILTQETQPSAVQQGQYGYFYSAINLDVTLLHPSQPTTISYSAPFHPIVLRVDLSLCNVQLPVYISVHI